MARVPQGATYTGAARWRRAGLAIRGRWAGHWHDACDAFAHACGFQGTDDLLEVPRPARVAMRSHRPEAVVDHAASTCVKRDVVAQTARDVSLQGRLELCCL